MPYALLDLDVSRPLPAVTLSEREDGVAALVRWRGRPVGFWIEPLAPGTRLGSEALAERAVAAAGEALLRARVRDALPPPQGDAALLPTLTVAVCTKDRPDWLARCLDALLALDPPEGMVSPSVLVVDNAPSDDHTRAVVAARPGVRYVREPRPGLDFARNRALAEATGDWLAFIDDDAVVDAGWLGGLAEAWRTHPDAAAVTGLVAPLVLETEAQVLFERAGGFRRGFLARRFGAVLPGNPHYPGGAGVFGPGANMAFRRSVLVELGGFDEALDTGAPLPGGGDLDVYYRLIRAGHPFVYEPSALVFHEHRSTMDGLRRQYHSWGLGFAAYVSKAYRTDSNMRERRGRLLAWWFSYQARAFTAAVRGRHALPPAFVLAEVLGGLQGLAGEYDRSRRRVARIRAAIPEAPVGPAPVLEAASEAAWPAPAGS